MKWQVIVALIVMVSVILLPVICVWYMNIRSALIAVRQRNTGRDAPKGSIGIVAIVSDIFSHKKRSEEN